VGAGHVHHELAEGFAPLERLESGGKAVVADGFRRVVGLGRNAVGDVAPRNAGQDVLHVRVIEAHHSEAIERDAARELDERVFDLFVRAVMIEVLGIDVRDHGDGRREAQERAVAFVRLGDEQISRAEPRIRAERRHLAADDDGGIEPGRAQDSGDERRGGRLAVRTGDGDAVLHAHELGQHLGAPITGIPDAPRGSRGCPGRWRSKTTTSVPLTLLARCPTSIAPRARPDGR
jgi:hypothetical protein